MEPLTKTRYWFHECYKQLVALVADRGVPNLIITLSPDEVSRTSWLKLKNVEELRQSPLASRLTAMVETQQRGVPHVHVVIQPFDSQNVVALN